MWDELRARRPGLLIDNCASGGRRSDTSCSPRDADWNQVETHGLGLYIPLHVARSWTPDPYDFRSSATAGTIAQWYTLDPTFPMNAARVAAAEARENLRIWYGDFYPLTSCSLAADAWMAYQLRPPDLNSGLVLAFRRGQSSYLALEVRLRWINPAGQYSMETLDAKRRSSTRIVTGRELSTGLEIRIAEQCGSLVLRYASVEP